MPAKIKLTVTTGPIEGKQFVFDAHDTFLFGRHQSCHARIATDGYVSRHHFLLETNPPDARIRDVGSRNGTYVNGKKYGGRRAGQMPEDVADKQFPQVDLFDGDEIRVGKTKIRVEVDVPPTCESCGSELGGEETGICDTCRDQRRERTGTFVRARPAQVCASCGGDVDDDICSWPSGQLVCGECRVEALSSGASEIHIGGDVADVHSFTPVISGYSLLSLVGRGAMGCVYKGQSEPERETVAVKFMHARISVTPKLRDSFQREIDTLRELQHGNIVRLIDSGAESNAFYFVTEFCDGGNLHQLQKKHGRPLSANAVSRIMLDCLDGLAFAHERGFVHRDIKPSNILLGKCPDAGRMIAKLGDFGLAKNFELAGLSGMTATGLGGGTYHYMPREQLTDFKYIKPTSDIWSLAATIYVLLTGTYPRECPAGTDPIRMILNDDAVPIRERRQDVGPSMADFIDRALLTDPEKRFHSAREMKSSWLEMIESAM